MFTVANLLDNLSIDEPIEVKKIEKILKLTKKLERNKLDIAIKALLKLGILENEGEGLLKRSKNDSFLEARLRCSSKGYCFAIRDDGKGEDIYIRDNYLNHAWNGDRVLVKISREAVRRRSPEGIVQCILERSKSNILSLLELEDENLFAIPLDDRILTSVHLGASDLPFYDKEKKENLVEVKIDRFPIAQYEAQGHIIRPLPLDGGNKGDIDILLTKNALQDCTQLTRSSIKNPSDKNRKDLTNQPCLILKSWKHKDSPALPAVHVEPKSGGIRLWVHSPSVAERVSLGNNLDHWLFERCEAQCLGDLWDPLLSENLARASEFKPGKLNKAISVELEISSDGEIKNWEFSLTQIKPVAEINPEHLESLNSRKPKSRAIPIILKPIKEYLVQLQTLIFCSSKIIDSEKKNGLIELDLPTPKVPNLSELLWDFPSSNLEQWKLPLNNNDPQSIINPLLRAANRAWYQHILNINIPGIIIQSDPIDNNTLNDVAKSTISLDLKLELDEEGIPNASELSSAFAKNESRRVLDKLLRHSLPFPKIKLYEPISQSISDSNEKDLKTKVFSRKTEAPWCCPSLHYYELINQHIQVLLLKEGKSRASTRQKNTLNLGEKDIQEKIEWEIFTETTKSFIDKIFTKKMVKHISNQHRKTKALRNGLISMAQARAAEPHLGEEMDAVISGVQSYGFFAEIIPFMAEGLVHVSSLNDDWYEYRSRQSRLVGRKNKQIYQLGDNIKVKIIKVDILRNQIDLVVCDTQINCETDQEILNTNNSDPMPLESVSK